MKQDVLARLSAFDGYYPWEGGKQTVADAVAEIARLRAEVLDLRTQQEMSMDRELIALFERKLAEALRAEHADAPFPMNAEQASAYHQTRADLLQWVLEMLHVPEPAPPR